MKGLKKLVSIIALVALMSSMSTAFACTTVAVGKKASADGSVLVAHTCDGWYDHRIQIIKGGSHAAGEMVDIYRDPCTDTKNTPELVGQIPQVENTYTYFNIGYPFMNDQGVVMSEFTWSGRDEVYCSNGLFVIANLEMLGLQRAATAREAVQVMGALAEQYGYCDGGECLLVADKDEVWIFEVCGGGMLWTPDSGKPGAHWAARRVPDDQVYSGANRSRLGVIDFNDTENYMWSTDITALPKEMGWWSEGQEFNFTDLFNPVPYGYPFYASRREWRVFSLLAPSQNFELKDRTQHYDFTITPDQPVTVQNIMDIYSDHLEGTEYDMTQGLAAGPFHNPTRWSTSGDSKPADRKTEDWEREIAQYRCSYSFVAQCRADMPAGVGTCLWFGEDSPDTTVYVPLYAGTTEVPVEWSTGNRKAFDPNCAWWAFNFVNNYANLRWDSMYEKIRAEKAKYENQFFADQAAIEAEAAALYASDPAAGAEYITKYVNDNMNKVNEGWWDFAWQLVGSYYDGMEIAEDGSSSNPGYPTEWLEAVDFGGTSVADQAKLSGETVPADEPEETEPADEPEQTEPAETDKADSKLDQSDGNVSDPNGPVKEVETESSNSTALIIGVVVALVVIAAAAFWYFTKKNKK